MIHPYTEVRFISEEKGYGLFATRFIGKGTVTWVRDQLDRELSEKELLAYDEAIQEVIIHYSYRNRRGNYIFCWDNTRYMNHDNSPNTCITPYNVEVAVRDIQDGEELTNHYGMLNIIEPFTLPEPYNTTVYPDDLVRHGAEWDLLLRDAFPHLEKVEQPLRRFMHAEQWLQLVAVSRGEYALEPLRNLAFVG